MKFYFIVLLAVFFQFSAYGRDSRQGVQVLSEYYRSGNYSAIRALIKKEPKLARDPQSIFYAGLAEARLQNYVKAESLLSEALSKGYNTSELYFELGLSQYAQKRWPAAFPSFKTAQKMGYKIATCAYYMGYIAQIQGNDALAVQYYHSIHGPDDLKGAALFQVAEIGLKKAEATADLAVRKSILKQHVVPYYEKSIGILEGTKNALLDEAKSRVFVIRSRYFTSDRKEFAETNWDLRFSQAFKYDSNLITQADQAPVFVSNTGSALETTALAVGFSYEHESIRLAPRAFGDVTFHGRRSYPRVYMNDNFNLGGGAKASYFYPLFQRSEVYVDYNYNYQQRDFNQGKDFIFFNEAHQLTLGHAWPIFSFGETGLRGTYRWVFSYNVAYDARIPGGILSQSFKFNEKTLLQLMLGAEFQQARHSRNDFNSFRGAGLLMLSDLIWQISAKPMMSVVVYNVREQTPTRGIEKLVSPAIVLTRPFGIFEVSLDYSWNRRFSHDKLSFQYAKHVMGLTFAVGL